MCNALESLSPDVSFGQDEAAIPTCKDMSELVTDYLDQALPWRMRIQARLHLFVCHACRRYFDQMRRTVGFLAGGPWQAPPPDIEERVLKVIAERAPSNEG